MYRFFKTHPYSTAGITILLFVGGYFLYTTLNPKAPNWTITSVSKGAVKEVVSVSGVVDAKNTAELAFPSSGKVTEVFVTEGQQVKQGEALATLASAQLVSQRNSATAQLRIAQAAYNKLIGGESVQTLAVAQTSVQNAQQALDRTIAEEKENVAHAKKILLSSALIAESSDINTQATAPLVIGSYTCSSEGTYTIELYNSGASSGYSYRFTGLESGTQAVGVNQPSELGICGLSLQFDAASHYSNSVWTIAIPNKQSAVYLTNANAYAQAQTQERNAVAKAQDTVTLAKKQSDEVGAPAQLGDVAQAQAQIDSAQARIGEVDAQMSDRSIIAPFDGIITNVAIVPGEITQGKAVITLLASDAFELKARILERDITKIKNGQHVTASFDASPTEILTGKVTYVSPLATTIDGVAYFEATVLLDTTPSWMKSGFNADMDIEIELRENVLRVPTQYIVTDGAGITSLFTPNGTKKATTTVTVLQRGTDGFTEITGLPEGQIVIAP